MERVPLRITNVLTSDTRHLSIERGAPFASLLSAARTAFAVDPVTSLALKYVDDDGDRVTLASDADLAEAVRAVQPGDALALFLLPGMSAQRKPESPAATERVAEKQEPQKPVAAAAEPPTESQRVQSLLLALWEVRDRASRLLPASDTARLLKMLLDLPSEEAAEVMLETLASEGVQNVLSHVVSVLADSVESRIHPLRNKSLEGQSFGVLCSVCKRPITDVRFKCMSCLDFSMCEGCDKIPGIHDPSHALLKGRCSSALASVFCPTLPPASAYPPTSPQSASFTVDYASPFRAKLVPDAPPAVYSQPFTVRPTPFFPPVEKQVVVQPAAPIAPIETKQPEPQAPSVAPALEKREEYTGEFVEDVTLPRGTLMQAGQRRIKIWRVRNTGVMAWKQNCHIDQVSGERVISAGSKSMRVPPAEPNKTVDVAVEFMTPAKAGAYETSFQIVDPDGRLVVNGLELLITVPEDTTKAQPPPYASVISFGLPTPPEQPKAPLPTNENIVVPAPAPVRQVPAVPQFVPSPVAQPLPQFFPSPQSPVAQPKIEEPAKVETPAKKIEEPAKVETPEKKPEPAARVITKEDYITEPAEPEAVTPLEVLAELGLTKEQCKVMQELESMGFKDLVKLTPLVKKYTHIQDIVDRALNM